MLHCYRDMNAFNVLELSRYMSTGFRRVPESQRGFDRHFSNSELSFFILKITYRRSSTLLIVFLSIDRIDKLSTFN